jgi:hypothetical protein
MSYARRQNSFAHTVQLVHLHATGFPDGMREKIYYEDTATQLYNLEGRSNAVFLKF